MMKQRIPRRRNLKDSNDGVATTVGTIMALLVFLSIFSLFTQQFVPVWMEDNEAYHMEEAMMQFFYMKGSVDNLVINRYTDYRMPSTIRLGSDGVPMLVGQTPGVLRVTPRWGGMHLRFDDNATGDIVAREFAGQGNVSLFVPNRYFEEQTIVYEHGAIILEQPQGAVIRAPPPIKIQEFVENGDQTYTISMNMVDLSSSRRDSIGGAGVVVVTTELWSTTRQSFANPEDLVIELETAYPDAWATWFRDSFDIDVVITGNTVAIDFSGQNVSQLSLTRSVINMELST